MSQPGSLTLNPQHPNGYVEVTAGVCGGKPRLAGTRIRVQDVVLWHERLGLSADEIASKHPQVSVAAIYSALSYYHDHRSEIDEQMRRSEHFADALRAAYPSKLPSRLPPQS